MSTPLYSVLSRMLADAPMLIAYIGGMVVCAAFWQRAPFAAMLALIGLALLLLVTLGSTFVYTYLLQNRGSTTAQSIGVYLSIAGFAFSLLRACGLALLLAGVFVQRRRDERGFDVQGM